MDSRKIIPVLSMPLMLVLVELGAILLSLPFQQAGITAFEDPSSYANPVLFVGILLIFTLFLLLLIRFGFRRIISLVIAASIFFTFIYIFTALVAFVITDSAVISLITLVAAALATAVLYLYPEWYVIDTFGLLISAGVASIFGVSLEVLPVIMLLVILAVYDFISVYKTKHMITLAEGVMDLKMPILFVIPKKRGYSFIKEGVGRLGEGKERSAFIIGMGDLIMPSVLVVSANTFLIGGKLFGLINLPALGAILGSLAGLAILLRVVQQGKPQAGLPPLNGCTILGFAAGFLLAALFRLSFGG
jgi:presenilin-like A22 family membrane protease